MKRRSMISLAYFLLAIAFTVQGLLMLLLPRTWASASLLPALQGQIQPLLVQWLGLTAILLASLFMWCWRRAKQRRSIHWALTLYVLAVAALHGLTLMSADYQGATPGFWLLALAQFVLPAVLMLAIAIPPRRVRNKGPREQGRVKWFNTTKGFGFITRDQGDDVFVHFRSIRGEGRRILQEGQRVEFVVAKGEKGLQAEDIVPF